MTSLMIFVAEAAILLLLARCLLFFSHYIWGVMFFIFDAVFVLSSFPIILLSCLLLLSVFSPFYVRVSLSVPLRPGKVRAASLM